MKRQEKARKARKVKFRQIYSQFAAKRIPVQSKNRLFLQEIYLGFHVERSKKMWGVFFEAGEQFQALNF